jgi:5'-deoxynucleotidase YfbR-like HD superfamily hydrolase
MAELQARKGDWMALASGQQFWPLDPYITEISVDDIAHHLGMICRYGGATKFHYSVAQHVVLICRWLRAAGRSPMEQFWGLHHDDSEAYIGDVIRPLKPEIKGYFAIEDHLMGAIADRFGLSPKMPAIVKEADFRICADERDLCLTPCVEPWGQHLEPLGVEILKWSPEEARAQYLQEHYRLVEEITNG